MATIYRRGRLRGDKVRYKDRVGVCLWFPLTTGSTGQEENAGLCWDISGDDVDDLINLLLDIREAPAEEYECTPSDVS